MFCGDNFNVVIQRCQKDQQGLINAALSAIAFGVDRVAALETEIFVDRQVAFTNTSLFSQFAQRTFHIAFAGIDVAFGKIPAAGMLHQ